MALDVVEEGRPVESEPVRLEILQRERETVVDADQGGDGVALADAPRLRRPSAPSKGEETSMTSEGAAELKSDALHTHREPRLYKLEIAAIKPLGNQRNLALAYSPDVAFACEAIAADTALSLVARARVTADCRLSGEANALIFPNLDAGSAALQLTRVIADALPVGPILVGPAKPAHVLMPSVTARGIVNMIAIAAAEAAGAQGWTTIEAVL
jgi:hypothetical protein